MKIFTNSISFIFLAIFTLSIAGCLKQDLDQPPVTGEAPSIEANTTIAELKAMHTLGNFEEITEDLIIKGTIIADDKSGNWFRSFVIQDETAGIEVRHTVADAYVFYPIGREVFIKCKGLYLGDFANLTQLGGYTFFEDGFNELGGIFDLTKHLFKGTRQNDVEPTVKSINELNLDDVSTLIRINDVGFSPSEVGLTLADAVGNSSLNRNFEPCEGSGAMVLRTSGFSEFAAALVPEGKGDIIGVYSVFGNTPQLYIRSLDDFRFDGAICGDAPPPCEVIVIEELEIDFQAFADGTDIFLPGWTNVALSGSRLWRATEFDGNIYAQATAFNDNSSAMDAWLVTPGFDLSSNKVMTFDAAMAFWNHDGFTVMISTDYDCNVATATWTELDATLPVESDDFHAWIPSGAVDLSGFSGTGHIAFRYQGMGPDIATTSIRIDNLIIEDE